MWGSFARGSFARFWLARGWMLDAGRWNLVQRILPTANGQQPIADHVIPATEPESVTFPRMNM
jgi:hypothetical protein